MIDFKFVGTRPVNQIPPATGGQKGKSKYLPIVEHCRAELKKFPGYAVELMMDKKLAERFQQHCSDVKVGLMVHIRENRVFVSVREGKKQ